MMRVLTIFLSFFFLNAQGQDNTLGLLQNQEAAFNGYTLFSPSADSSTYLIDNCGQLVHQWKGFGRPGRTAVLREDGLLLRCEQVGAGVNSGWGGGSGGRLLLINWEGEVEWDYVYASDNYLQHHEAALMPNGNILIIAWDLHEEADALLNGRDPALLNNVIWSEKVVELKPIGTNDVEVVWEWYLWDHLIQDYDETKENYGVVAEHPELIDLNFDEPLLDGPGGSTSADWIHLNSIDYNAELDQIVIGSRDFSEFWVIDHSTTTEEAAGHSGGNTGKGGDILFRWGNPIAYQRGTSIDQKFFKQHNVRWTKVPGTDIHQISVFNNGLDREPVEYSTVDIVTPPFDGVNYILDEGSSYLPADPYVFYGDGPSEFIYSLRISSAQQQPNGNFLIDIGMAGRFIEVDDVGNVVWEYLNPVGAFGAYDQGEIALGNSVFNVTRYPVDYPGFEGIELIPNGFVEGNPTDSDCEIYPEIDVGLDDRLSFLDDLDVNIYPNPSSEFINLSLDNQVERDLQVFDATGRLVIHTTVHDFKKLNISNLSSGRFYLVIDGLSAGVFVKY